MGAHRHGSRRREISDGDPEDVSLFLSEAGIRETVSLSGRGGAGMAQEGDQG